MHFHHSKHHKQDPAPQPGGLQLPPMDTDLSGLSRDLQSVRVSSDQTHAPPVPSHHTPPGRAIPRKPIYGEPETTAGILRDPHALSNHPLPMPPSQHHSNHSHHNHHSSTTTNTYTKHLPDLTGIVDLRNTADTTVDERVAPAVVHERRNHDIKRVREERIIREIHNHDVFHRIQPIIDVEVLPARHFVPAADGSLREVPESTLPGRVRDRVQNWIVAETVSRIPSAAPVDKLRRNGPREFTARRFAGKEGDFKRWFTPDGVERTETTWVHPPVLEEGARLTGQTVPIHFGLDEAGAKRRI